MSMIQMAVIGAGHWGPTLVRNFHNQQRSVVRWVCDTEPARLAQVAARYPDVATTIEASEALSDPAVEAVVGATPTTTHHQLVKAALEQSKHVLGAKPLAARA